MAAIYGGAVRNGSEVIAWLSKRIAAIQTSRERLRESKYRLPIRDEPESAIDGRYYVDLDSVSRSQAMHVGDGEQAWDGTFSVYVGYFAGGGAGVGDRKTVAQRAVDDSQRIADVVEDPDFFEDLIGEAQFLGQSTRFALLSESEIWRHRFRVMWRSGTARE